MYRGGFLCLICGIWLNVSAQTVSLSGKVSDENGNGIAGAIVNLKTARLADTTDNNGAYSLSGNLTSLNPSHLSNRVYARLHKGILEVMALDLKPIQVDFYDMQGSYLGKIVEKPSQKGMQKINIKNSLNAANMMILKISIGTQSAEMEYLSLGKGYPLNPGHSKELELKNPMEKAAAAEDALEVTALGYKTSSLAITSYEGVFDFTLELEFTGNCTESNPVNSNVSGSGPHDVVVETNSDDGIDEGTIYRPADLGPGKMYPIFVWGEGACSLDGLSNEASMAELASHGYFVVADGTPGGSGGRNMNANDLEEMGRPMIGYMDWAIAENKKPCSKYYQSLDTSKIGANGFSCGGLLSMGTASDPRISTWGLTSSGSFNNNPSLWNSTHTPVLIIEGHQDETGAYDNGLRDYNGIAPLGQPIMFFSNRNMGHGGDLWSRNGGDFTRINLAWLNWWLKGDEGATGKGQLVGPGCSYCSDSQWEVKSDNLP